MGIQKIFSYIVLMLLPVMMVSYIMEHSCKKNMLVHEQVEVMEILESESYQENELASDIMDLPDFLFNNPIAVNHMPIVRPFEYFKNHTNFQTFFDSLISPPPQVG